MRRDFALRPAAAVLAAGLILAAGSGLCQEAAGPAGRKLVRTDLLAGAKAEIASPRRDIFRARAIFAPPVLQEPEPEASQPPDPEPEEGGRGQAAPEPALDLIYVGYISSHIRTVALVVIEGQAQAVAEGEEIFPGVKIEKVSRERIRLIGPGSKRTDVPLQGEES